MQTRINVRSVSMIGVLVALEMVLTRFLTIHTWNLKIGFSFVPVVVAAILYGPVTAGLVAAIGDVIAAVLFPVGAFFPGFTLSAFLTGIVFGLFLKKSQSAVRIAGSVVAAQFVISQILNTYWIAFLYGSPYLPLFATRIYQTAVMTVVESVSIYLIAKRLIPILRQFEQN